MSEEILKALMQLFALIAKQDDGVQPHEIEYVEIFLAQQLASETVREYMALFEQHAGIGEQDEETSNQNQGNKKRLTSVRDSVRILGLVRR